MVTIIIAAVIGVAAGYFAWPYLKPKAKKPEPIIVECSEEQMIRLQNLIASAREQFGHKVVSVEKLRDELHG